MALDLLHFGAYPEQSDLSVRARHSATMVGKKRVRAKC